MQRDIYNKERAINEKKKMKKEILLELQGPFHRIFVKQSYRKWFKNNVNRLID